MNKKFYENGIKFECQGSSNCCVSRGNFGFVYLSSEDLKKNAQNIVEGVSKLKDWSKSL